MKKRFGLASIFLVFIVFVGRSQSVLAEFQLSEDRIRNIQPFTFGDTILLSVDITNKKVQVDSKRFCEIYPDGSSKLFGTSLIGSSPLCGASHQDNGYYMHYLTGKKKNLILKAIHYNTLTNDQKIMDGGMQINGELVGSWVDKNLFLVIYDRNANQLRVAQINKMDIKNERVFDLPIDLTQNSRDIVYIPESRFTSIAQGSAKFKLYKFDKELILTADYTLVEGAESSNTRVVRMNLEDGSLSTKKFTDNSLQYYRSFIKNNLLYRAAVSKKNFKLKINHLTTGSSMSQKEIVRDTTFKDSLIYTRVGSDFRINRKADLYFMMKTSIACLPSVVVTEEDSSSNSLIWGTYFNDKGSGGFIGPDPFVGILSAIIITAIKQTQEPPGIQRYFYLENSPDSPFDFKENKKKTLRQQIDDYEISLDLERTFSDYKGYFDYQDGGVGVYQGHRDDKNKLTLIKFDRKTNGASN